MVGIWYELVGYELYMVQSVLLPLKTAWFFSASGPESENGYTVVPRIYYIVCMTVEDGPK